MGEETEKRFDKIQEAANRLHKGLNDHDFNEITGYIEALCRHRDAPVTLATPPAILSDLSEGVEG